MHSIRKNYYATRLTKNEYLKSPEKVLKVWIIFFQVIHTGLDCCQLSYSQKHPKSKADTINFSEREAVLWSQMTALGNFQKLMQFLMVIG